MEDTTFQHSAMSFNPMNILFDRAQEIIDDAEVKASSYITIGKKNVSPSSKVLYYKNAAKIIEDAYKRANEIMLDMPVRNDKDKQALSEQKHIWQTDFTSRMSELKSLIESEGGTLNWSGMVHTSSISNDNIEWQPRPFQKANDLIKAATEKALGLMNLADQTRRSKAKIRYYEGAIGHINDAYRKADEMAHKGAGLDQDKKDEITKQVQEWKTRFKEKMDKLKNLIEEEGGNAKHHEWPGTYTISILNQNHELPGTYTINILNQNHDRLSPLTFPFKRAKEIIRVAHEDSAKLIRLLKKEPKLSTKNIYYRRAVTLLKEEYSKANEIMNVPNMTGKDRKDLSEQKQIWQSDMDNLIKEYRSIMDNAEKDLSIYYRSTPLILTPPRNNNNTSGAAPPPSSNGLGPKSKSTKQQSSNDETGQEDDVMHAIPGNQDPLTPDDGYGLDNIGGGDPPPSDKQEYVDPLLKYKNDAGNLIQEKRARYDDLLMTRKDGKLGVKITEQYMQDYEDAYNNIKKTYKTAKVILDDAIKANHRLLTSKDTDVIKQMKAEWDTDIQIYDEEYKGMMKVFSDIRKVRRDEDIERKERERQKAIKEARELKEAKEAELRAKAKELAKIKAKEDAKAIEEANKTAKSEGQKPSGSSSKDDIPWYIIVIIIIVIACVVLAIIFAAMKIISKKSASNM